MIKHKTSAFLTTTFFVVLAIGVAYVGSTLAQTKGSKQKTNLSSGQADAAQPGRVVTATVTGAKAEGSGRYWPSGGCQPGTWSTATTGPSARYRAGGVSDGTYVYVFGGGTSTATFLNDLWRWNPATQTWAQLANMPTAKQNIQGAYWNGKIYVPGGYIGSHITENAIYDIATNTWTTGAPLPAAQSGQNVAFNNKIYNFGGNPGPQNTTAIYDIATNSWSTGAPMPAATTYGRATVAGNFAYYVGGITSVTTNAVYRYDFAANSWTTMTPLQTARTSEELMTSPDSTKLFAVMGGDSTFFTGVPLPQSVEIYNIASNAWSYGNPVVNKAAAPSGGLAANKAMVQGGVDNTTYYDAVQVSQVPCGLTVTTTSPACNSIVFTPPVDFVINLTDPVDPATVQASDFTVNGTPANSFVLGGGNTQITFHFNSSPVVTQGVQTMHIPAGAFNRASDGGPVAEFMCTFCYAVTALQVTSTVPAVGGTFNPPAPGDYSYDVIFNQNIDAASVTTSDLTLTGNAGGSVTAVSVSGNTAHFTVHFNFGGSVTASIGAGAITANGCNGNAAFTGNYTVSGCPPSDHYTISQIGGSIVPGDTDIGNHGDDTVTTVALPFSYSLYDQTYNSVNLSSNGNAQFTTTDTAFTNSCLPWTTHNYTIYPYWDDLYLVNATYGIFTSVSGTAPNRIFNIEWRAQYFPGSGGANFELRLYEGQTRFDVIYGTVTNANTSATAGVQKNDTAFDQYFCNGAGMPATGAQSYILTPCNLVTITGAVSRMSHGGSGNFDVALPLTGTDGVEDRTKGGTHDFTMVVTFAGNVTVTGSPQAQVTSGAGCVGSGGVCTGNVTVSGNVVTVPLTTVTNAQNINVRINGVNGAGSDAPATDFNIPMGVLAGDTNANRTVNAGDIAQTKSRLGQTVDGTNFRSDVNANGTINAADVAIVKQNSGTSIP